MLAKCNIVPCKVVIVGGTNSISIDSEVTFKMIENHIVNLKHTNVVLTTVALQI